MMPEYIERETLLNELSEELEDESPLYTKEQNELINTGLRIAMKDVKYSHAADVVEVVRCKDCIHRDKAGLCRAEGQKLTIVQDNHFCGKGERKDGD